MDFTALGRRRVLLAFGMVGTIVYWTSVLVLSATRPGYDPTRINISALEHGPLGWIQDAAFIALGPSIGAVGYALRPDFRVTRRGPVRWCAFPIFAVYFLLLGIFRENPPSVHTLHGAVHTAIVGALSLCFPLTAVIMGGN
jgi:hypothetical membrane protein